MVKGCLHLVDENKNMIYENNNDVNSNQKFQKPINYYLHY